LPLLQALPPQHCCCVCHSLWATGHGPQGHLAPPCTASLPASGCAVWANECPTPTPGAPRTQHCIARVQPQPTRARQPDAARAARVGWGAQRAREGRIASSVFRVQPGTSLCWWEWRLSARTRCTLACQSCFAAFLQTLVPPACLQGALALGSFYMRTARLRRRVLGCPGMPWALQPASVWV